MAKPERVQPGGADTLVKESLRSSRLSDKQGKTKIQLLCLVRDRVFFRVGESYGPLVRTANAKIIQPKKLLEIPRIKEKEHELKVDED